jgi:hypothetical protein
MSFFHSQPQFIAAIHDDRTRRLRQYSRPRRDFDRDHDRHSRRAG